MTAVEAEEPDSEETAVTLVHRAVSANLSSALQVPLVETIVAQAPVMIVAVAALPVGTATAVAAPVMTADPVHSRKKDRAPCPESPFP